MRTVTATRYVTPLREGGSLPAIVEADDGTYVCKFRGAGQGPKALIAELVAGEIARTLGLPVPELVFLELDPVLGRSEADPEIRDLILGSAGLNLGMDFLPGSIGFDAAIDRAELNRDLASRIVWFDAFVMNVDRTARNPNLLLWHRNLSLIDHGAALYFQHNWATASEVVVSAFPLVRDHVLLSRASHIAAADAQAAALLNEGELERISGLIPDAWLTEPSAFEGPAAEREAYARSLKTRLANRANFVEEAARAHQALL